MFSIRSVPESASLRLVLCLLNAFVSDGKVFVGTGNGGVSSGEGSDGSGGELSDEGRGGEEGVFVGMGEGVV